MLATKNRLQISFGIIRCVQSESIEGRLRFEGVDQTALSLANAWPLIGGHTPAGTDHASAGRALYTACPRAILILTRRLNCLSIAESSREQLCPQLKEQGVC